ncbi:hypothetical protein HDU97_008903 [Phlyctochytrium planicorne]|nr:hypothetical protein HDU97_008903 [Phlyctochytrium planicorne]
MNTASPTLTAQSSFGSPRLVNQQRLNASEYLRWLTEYLGPENEDLLQLPSPDFLIDFKQMAWGQLYSAGMTERFQLLEFLIHDFQMSSLKPSKWLSTNSANIDYIFLYHAVLGQEFRNLIEAHSAIIRHKARHSVHAIPQPQFQTFGGNETTPLLMSSNVPVVQVSVADLQQVQIDQQQGAPRQEPMAASKASLSHLAQTALVAVTVAGAVCCSFAVFNCLYNNFCWI